MKKLFFMFAILLSFVATANSARSAPKDVKSADQAAELNQDLLVVIGSTNTGTLSALYMEVDNISSGKVLRASASNKKILTLCR